MTQHQQVCNPKYQTERKEQLGGKEFSNECAQSLVQEKGGMVYSESPIHSNSVKQTPENQHCHDSQMIEWGPGFCM